MSIQGMLDEAWKAVAGELAHEFDWLKQVIFGEFQDNRSTSAVVADMLVSFLPFVVIVTSARDLTAVILRLIKHPERQSNLEEWMLVVACVLPLALPLVVAAGGAVAGAVGAGVGAIPGAIIGGIAGSEAGAVLRAVCLLLIKKSNDLAHIVGFLTKIVKGNTLKVLHDIKFTHYSKAIIAYLNKYFNKLRNITFRLKTQLYKLNVFNQLTEVIAKLERLERGFYNMQTNAVTVIPKALAELDVRLQHVLSQVLPPQVAVAHAGVSVANVTAMTSNKGERVASIANNPLGTPKGTVTPKPPKKVEEATNLHPQKPKKPKLKKIEPQHKVKPCFNKGKQLQKNAHKRGLTPDKLDKEFQRQLDGQADGLNNMTANEFLTNLDAFDPKKSRGLSAAAQQKTRDDAFERIRLGKEEELKMKGMSQKQAEIGSQKHATDVMSTMAALHNPDMSAGGGILTTDIGDKGVNSSIGSQWQQNGRVEAMRKQAEAAQKAGNGDAYMNVALEKCP